MKFGFVRRIFMFAIIAALIAAALFAPQARAQNSQVTPAPSTRSAQPAQAGQGTIRGTVTDPTGAAVGGAAVVLMSSSGQFTPGKTNQTGGYSISGLAPGSYTLTVNADGFAVYEQDNVQISTGQIQTANAKLALAAQSQSVQVSGQAVTVAVNPEENASAVVIQGKDLQALSDDPDELQSELEALAGPSAGPSGGQMYIDGFQAGQLPPKSAIREIIINQNPFSAEYPEPGFGRIQILTKPGTDKLHGDFFVIGNDSAFNTLTPFISPADVPPPYHTVQFSADVSGPLNKKASYFIEVEQRNINQASVVDAETGLEADGVTGIFTQDTVLNPQVRTEINPRIDFQLTKTNTLTARYQFTRGTNMDSGIGQNNLPSLGYNTSSIENTVQLTDDQTFGTKVLMETRFQYNRDNDSSTAQNFAPEILVPGDFAGGGNTVGRSTGVTSHYELDSFTQLTLSKNIVRFGARLDQYEETNTSIGDFNGRFQWPSLQAYDTFVTDSALGTMTDAQIVANGGGASQYSVSAGNPTASVGQFQIGLYAEDDWRIIPAVTLSYGLRYETQTNLSDHHDFAPRVSLSWGIGHAKGGPKTVLRAGYGVFYSRFDEGNTLDVGRFNGLNQQTFNVNDPCFFPDDAPAASASLPSCPNGTIQSSSTENSPTIDQAAPNLTSPYQMEFAGSLEQQLGKSATLSVTYVNSHGLHQFLTDNVNAYLPGTYSLLSPNTGVRPLAGVINPVTGTDYGSDDVYQYQSKGIFHQNQLIVSLNYRFGSRITLFGYYTLSYANADTNGIGSFPSNPYNVMADYGRAGFDVRHRAFIGGTINLPKGIRLNPLISVQSGSPFNITVGQDLNGDSIFNDRPGIATGANISNVSVIDTAKYGYLDTLPTAGEALIPINDGTGPGLFTFNLRISKTFGFGEKPGSCLLYTSPSPRDA